MVREVAAERPHRAEIAGMNPTVVATQALACVFEEREAVRFAESGVSVHVRHEAEDMDQKHSFRFRRERRSGTRETEGEGGWIDVNEDWDKPQLNERPHGRGPSECRHQDLVARLPRRLASRPTQHEI